MASDEKETTSVEVRCPCCEATLVVDRATGTVIHHQAKQEAKNMDSIGDILQNLKAKKESSEKLFASEMASLKDRDRILEERLQEALKRAKESKDEKPVRDIDL